MNKDKIIKDLKERNDKLANQYRLRDIRCVHLEMENEKLQQENKLLSENYERIYNENCILRENHNINDISLLDENEQLKSILTEIENMCKEEYYERNTIDIDSIVLSSHLDARIYLKIKELKEKYK